MRHLAPTVIILCAAMLGARHLEARTTALVGATIVDVSHFGTSADDISNSVILIDDGRISAIGDARNVKIPTGANRIDARGQFLIPGLIDGFGSQRTTGFAHAYLYEGVTTIVIVRGPDGEDGEQHVVQSPIGPDIRTGISIGGYSLTGEMPKVHPWTNHRLHDKQLSPKALVAAVDAAAERGTSGVLIGFDALPDQVRAIVQEARRRHLFTMAEPAFTTYAQAVAAGVDVLLRNDRYDTAIAQPANWPAYADDPEGRGGAPAFHDVCNTNASSPGVLRLGALLARSTTALMPILSMEATADDLGIPDPWTLPGARFVAASDLDNPVDPRTGAHPYLEAHPERKAALKSCAYHREAIDAALRRAGAHYLTGTTTPSYGIMPGSGVHQELALMQRIGFTPREALAAATGNFAAIYRWGDIGLVAKGRTANLVLLAKDPRKDVGNVDSIEKVILRGEVVDRQLLLPRS